MKCEFCKTWLLIIVSLSIGLYVAYRFVPTSALKKLYMAADSRMMDSHKENTAPKALLSPPAKDSEDAKKLANNAVLTKEKTQNGSSLSTKIPFQLDTEQYQLQISSGLKKLLPSWLVSQWDQLKITLTALLILVLLLLIIGGKAFYNRRIRLKTYRGYKELQQVSRQSDSCDLAVIDQGITTLTQLSNNLAKRKSVPLSHTPVFYSLCTHVDYMLNRLEDKRYALVDEPVSLPNTEDSAVLAQMQQVEKSLDRLVAQIQSQPVPTYYYETKPSVETIEDETDTSQTTTLEQQPVTCSDHKNPSTDDQCSEIQEQSQPLPEQLDLSAAIAEELPPVVTPKPLPVVDTTLFLSKFAKITAWKNKKWDNKLREKHQEPLPNIELSQPIEAVEDIPLTVTPQSTALGQSLRKFAPGSFWKKKAGTKPVAEQEYPQVGSPILESSPLPEITESLVQTEVTNDSKYQQAQALVRKHILAGMALSAVPVPIVDVATLTATQLNLLHSLSDHYGLKFDKDRSKPLVVALLSGCLPTTTLMWLSSLSKSIPGIGTLVGGVSLSATAGAVIYATGQVFIKHFEAGGGLHDFDNQQQRKSFQQALKEGFALNAKESA